MNAEHIKAAREALDNMDDYARMNTGVDAIGPRSVLERFISEAECTTAPVSLTDEQIIQRVESHINTDPDCFDLQDGDSAYWIKQSEMVKFARALLAAAPAPIQQEPEVTHKRQVFMDEIDAAKAGSEWLEPFFGPGFRLCFSVDEGARAPQAKWCMLFDSLDRVVAGYMLTRDAKNWTELTKVGPHATSPALAGSQVQAAGDAVQCTLGVGNGNGNLFVVGDYDSIKAAQAWILRAEKSESRLAEIQRGVEGLKAWLVNSGYQGVDIEAVSRDAVLALLQPQGQADTSGMPG